MSKDNLQKFTFNMENDNGELVVKGEIIGESEIRFFDDLKFNGVIALLNSIDKRNFAELGKIDLFDRFMLEIGDTINEMRKYEQFQGENNP